MNLTWRLALLPFAAAVEAAVLAMCWALAFIRPETAARLGAWAKSSLPDLNWYRNAAVPNQHNDLRKTE